MDFFKKAILKIKENQLSDLFQINASIMQENAQISSIIYQPPYLLPFTAKTEVGMKKKVHTQAIRIDYTDQYQYNMR